MANHEMRISSGGNVAAYTRFAKTYLSENPDSALILHTKPKPESEPELNTKSPSQGLHSSTLAAPRLISVVEKIKREYAGPLWQYNESGVLGATEAERPSLERVLGGKTKPKMTHRPYLQITLSTKPLGWEGRHGVTLQKSEKPKLKKGKVVEKGRKDGGKDGGKSDEGLEKKAEQKTEKKTDVKDEKRGKRKSEAADGPSKRVKT